MSEGDRGAAGPALGVGVIGLGFMGRTHVGAYQRVARERGWCRLVAVADADAGRRSGTLDAIGNIDARESSERLFDPALVRSFASATELLEDGAVEIVSICTPSDTHVDLAIGALERGKHVLVEKPVSTSVEAVERLAVVARAHRAVCMPAMCIRFWPAWRWLRDRVVDRALGELLSLTLERMGSVPAWSPGFYGDASRTGGALFDLHVHDTDFVCWCLGTPRGVTSRGDAMQMATLYDCEGVTGPIVAIGGWKQSPSFGFRMRYTASFERGTADFDLARTPELLVHDATGSHTIALGALTGWQVEVEHFVRCVREGLTPDATMDGACVVTRVLEAEARSLVRGTIERIDA